MSTSPTRNDEYWALLEDDAVLTARIARLERLPSGRARELEIVAVERVPGERAA